MPSEVQPFCRMARRILVRIMSKVTCAGSTSAKVTMRFRAISRGSGSKGASSAQAGPTGRAGAARAAAQPRRRQPAAGAAPRRAVPWLSGWRPGCVPCGLFSGLGGPGAAAGTARRRHVAAVGAGAGRLLDRLRESGSRSGRAACSRCAARRAPPGSPPRSAPAPPPPPRASSGSRAGCGCRAPWRRAGCRARPTRSTGRRIERFSISISTTKPMPGADAADHAGGGDQQPVRAVGPARHGRLLDQREALALGQHLDALADLGLAAARHRVVVLRLQASRARARARRAPSRWPGVAWIEASSSASVSSITAFSSAMNFSRSSIGASSTSSSVSGSAALPSASGSARAARCSLDQLLERRDAGLQHPDRAGSTGL